MVGQGWQKAMCKADLVIYMAMCLVYVWIVLQYIALMLSYKLDFSSCAIFANPVTISNADWWNANGVCLKCLHMWLGLQKIMVHLHINIWLTIIITKFCRQKIQQIWQFTTNLPVLPTNKIYASWFAMQSSQSTNDLSAKFFQGVIHQSVVLHGN